MKKVIMPFTIASLFVWVLIPSKWQICKPSIAELMNRLMRKCSLRARKNGNIDNVLYPVIIYSTFPYLCNLRQFSHAPIMIKNKNVISPLSPQCFRFQLACSRRAARYPRSRSCFPTRSSRAGETTPPPTRATPEEEAALLVQDYSDNLTS